MAGIAESVPAIFYVWNGTSWVLRYQFTTGQASGYEMQALFSVPVSDLVNRTWNAEKVVRSVLTNDQVFGSSLKFASDGNLWTVFSTWKLGSTGATTTVTYGGVNVTTNSYSTTSTGSMIVYRGGYNANTGTFNAGTVTAAQSTTSDIGRFAIQSDPPPFGLSLIHI